MRRVLVTGAAGFIGRPVVAALLARGYSIHATARPSSRAYPMPDAVTTHSCDLLNSTRLEALVRSVRPEILVHLGWVTTPGEYWESLENLDWLNASTDLFRYFLDAGGSHCLVAGTSAEYEWGTGGPLSETQSPLKPRFLYGSCKLALFHAATALFSQRNIPLAWARLFCPFGPGESSLRLIPRTVLGLLRGEQLEVDAGVDIRDFMHVEDIASAIATLVERQVDGAVNVASGEPMSVRAVIEEIAACLRAQAHIVFGAAREPGLSPLSVVASVGHLQKVAHWKPRSTFSERIAQTCEYWRVRLREESGLEKSATVP